MGSFNKVLSFILGLVVVIVFIIILSRRLNISDSLLPFQSDKTPTVTKDASKKPDSRVTPTSTVGFYPGQQDAQSKGGTIKTIPATGSPTSLLLVLNSALLLGFYLRKKTS